MTKATQLFFVPLLLIVFFPLSLSAQQSFEFNKLMSPEEIRAKTGGEIADNRHYFELNTQIFSEDKIANGDLIQVYVEPGHMSEFEVIRKTSYRPGTVSYITKGKSDAHQFFSFTVKNDKIAGYMHDHEHAVRMFEFDPATSSNYAAKEADLPHDPQICGVHDHEEFKTSTILSRQQSRNKTALQQPIQNPSPNWAAVTETLEDEITIDLIIAYTAKAKEWALDVGRVEDIDVVIAQALNLTQTAHDNSQTGVLFRLVHAYETDYTDDDTNTTAGTHLERFTQNPDNPVFDNESRNGFMEEVHQLRDQFGADMATLFASEPNTGGIAWVNTSTVGNENLAFSVNRVQQMDNSFTLAHELGHNMGMGHARNQPNSPAGPFGGLFEYSVGFRYAGVRENGSSINVATVMAYTDGGFTRVAYFSNPDEVVFEESAGSPEEGGDNPANAVRSIKEIKRAVSAYRSSIVDPPVQTILDDQITVTLTGDNETANVSIPILNAGDTELTWSIDFDFPEGVVNKKRKAVNMGESISPKQIDLSNSKPEFNAPSFMNDDGSLVFETGFESEEGFQIGDHGGHIGWRGLLQGNKFFIGSLNPSEGSNNLRISATRSLGDPVVARTPFIGPQPFGEYELSVDIALNQNPESGESQRFDVYIYDGSTAEMSSGIVISNGNLFARDTNPETGETAFFGTGFSPPDDGTYFNLKVEYDPDERLIHYFIDDQLITSNVYTTGKKPEYAWFLHFNDVESTSMDIDNFKVIQGGNPFKWLDVNKHGGVIAPGESDDLTLSFTNENVDDGTFEATLLVNSNDPAEPVLEIPIQLNVEMAVSNEVVSTQPETFTLSQNYPNPFNPTTTINYTLGQAENVILEVYNIAGQKVATLLNEQQTAGSHQVQFDASNLSSGVYMYRLQTPTQNAVRSMVLIK